MSRDLARFKADEKGSHVLLADELTFRRRRDHRTLRGADARTLEWLRAICPQSVADGYPTTDPGNLRLSRLIQLASDEARDIARRGVTIDSIMKPVLETPTGDRRFGDRRIGDTNADREDVGEGGLRWYLSAWMKPRAW